MREQEKQYGYYAVDRQMLDHPLFQRADWFKAWQWLDGHAAWKVKGARLSFGTIELQRGQLAVTIRGLAEAWNWPRTNVTRFLHKLKAAGILDFTVCGTKTGTKTGTKISYRATIITICNYGRLQSAMKVSHGGVGQKVGQETGQSRAVSIVQTDLFGVETSTNKETIDRESAAKGNLRKPAHGSRSTDRKWVWFDHATMEWSAHAAEYDAVRGASILPEKRVGGNGNWFYWFGEELAPKRRRRKTA